MQKNMKNHELNMFQKHMYLCEGARFILLINKWSLVGLTNGSIGTLRYFDYDVTDLAYMPPNIPRLVWVDFEPWNYKGPSFFPDVVTRSN